MSLLKKTRKSAVALLSGGMDSTTTLALAKKRGFRVYALTVQYGQRHQKEIESAKRICKKFGVQRHLVIEVDLRKIGRSSLTDKIAVPKERSLAEIMSRIPTTYVPARNTILLSLALAWAEMK
jgi:7-cyano-7-deazaguanine synthase